MKLEIEFNKTKDLEDISYKDIEVETPAFTMVTDTAYSILTEEGLGATSFAIYLTILKHRNMTTNKCFPSISTISKESGISVPSTKKIITRLEEHGYLSINSGYKGTANNYYFPKEWFYELFADDFYQQRATRRHNPLKDKRETKVEKENKQLKKEIAELKNEKSVSIKKIEEPKVIKQQEEPKNVEHKEEAVTVVKRYNSKNKVKETTDEEAKARQERENLMAQLMNKQYTNINYSHDEDEEEENPF